MLVAHSVRVRNMRPGWRKTTDANHQLLIRLYEQFVKLPTNSQKKAERQRLDPDTSPSHDSCNEGGTAKSH